MGPGFLGKEEVVGQIFELSLGYSRPSHYHGHASRQDFQAGMRLYLRRHQFGNTFTEDLWAALQEASGRPVAAVMSSWTRQTGYPVVRVAERRDSNGQRVLSLSQRRFLADGKPDGQC